MSVRKKSASGGPVTANFRPFVEKGRWAAKGTLPLSEPITVPEIFTKVVVHCCRKVLFFDQRARIVIYSVMLFFFSLVSDYLPFPKTYFSQSNNFLNVYFVKYSWGWTLLFTGTFTFLTASTYCCGNRPRIIQHMIRLVIATIVWFLWTNVFRLVEESTGQCIMADGHSLYSIRSRRACLSKSGRWTSFDISGHSFLLIWCVFVITEEAKAIIGWDGIKDLIRNEEHFRGKRRAVSGGDSSTDTSLTSLSDEEFEQLKQLYPKYSIPAKLCLIFMTFLCVIWDLMILMTSIYFHVMIEKVIGGLIGLMSWVLIYKGLFPTLSSIGLPGQGLFKYNVDTAKPSAVPVKPAPSTSISTKSKASTVRQRVREDDVPKFMGMPLNALRNSNKDKQSEGERGDS